MQRSFAVVIELNIFHRAQFSERPRSFCCSQQDGVDCCWLQVCSSQVSVSLVSTTSDAVNRFLLRVRAPRRAA